MRRELNLSLDQARQGSAAVIASRARLASRMAKLEAEMVELHHKSVAAVQAGDDETARRLLHARGNLKTQLEQLGQQDQQLAEQEVRLRALMEEAEHRLILAARQKLGQSRQ